MSDSTDTIGFGWMTTIRADRIARKPIVPAQKSVPARSWWKATSSAAAAMPPPIAVRIGRPGATARTSAAAITTMTSPVSRCIRPTPSWTPNPSSRPTDQHDERHPQDVRQRQRQQPLPPDVHQLVVAEARQGPAHPDVDEQED